jgi:hypothetical protein
VCRKLIAVDWRGIIGGIIVAIPILMVLALMISCLFDLPALAHMILDPLFRFGEWCYDVYHKEFEMVVSIIVGLALIVVGSAGWYYIVQEPKREQAKKWGQYIEYIERVLRDPDLMQVWVKGGIPEGSHEQRASDRPIQ